MNHHSTNLSRVEQDNPEGDVDSSADRPVGDSRRQQLIADLGELVRALEQRVPHIERDGEVTIARDAASLRDKALERIARLEQLP